MKIIIDVPDWAAERHIAIMAGSELLAYKPYGQDNIHIKTQRCNHCGWCCKNNLKEPCPHLKFERNEYVCGLGERPWQCLWADPVLTKNPEALEHCNCRYEIKEI